MPSNNQAVGVGLQQQGMQNNNLLSNGQQNINFGNGPIAMNNNLPNNNNNNFQNQNLLMINQMHQQLGPQLQQQPGLVGGTNVGFNMNNMSNQNQKGGPFAGGPGTFIPPHKGINNIQKNESMPTNRLDVVFDSKSSDGKGGVCSGPGLGKKSGIIPGQQQPISFTLGSDNSNGPVLKSGI